MRALRKRRSVCASRSLQEISFQTASAFAAAESSRVFLAVRRARRRRPERRRRLAWGCFLEGWVLPRQNATDDADKTRIRAATTCSVRHTASPVHRRGAGGAPRRWVSGIHLLFRRVLPHPGAALAERKEGAAPPVPLDPISRRLLQCSPAT